MHSICVFSLNADPAAQLSEPFAGGQTKTVRTLALKLAAAGWQISIFTLESRNRPIIEKLFENCVVYRLPAKSQSGFDYSYTKSDVESLLPALLSMYTFSKEDLFVGCYWAGGYLARLAAKKTNSQTITMMCSYGMERFDAEEKCIDEENLAARIEIEREILAHSTGIIACTDYEKILITEKYNVKNKNIFICPRGVDENIFFPRLNILFIGRFVPRKGLGTLVEAIEINPALKLVLTIIGVSEQELHSKYPVTKLNSKFLCLGDQPQPRVAQEISRCDVVAIPSHYETFGNVAIEAISCGKPVIASAVGGLLETIKTTGAGILVPPNNPIELHNAISLLERSPEKLEEITRRAKESSSLYENTVIYSKIAEHILNIMSRK